MMMMMKEGNGAWSMRFILTRWFRKDIYSHLKQYIDRPNPPKLSLAFHPNDGDIIYLIIKYGGYHEFICKQYQMVISSNMRRKTLEVIFHEEFTRSISHPADDVFTLVLPCWPTRIPSLLEDSVLIPSNYHSTCLHLPLLICDMPAFILLVLSIDKSIIKFYG